MHEEQGNNNSGNLIFVNTKILVDLQSSRSSENRSLDGLIASNLSELLEPLNKTGQLRSITFIVNDPYMFISSLSSTRALISALASFSPGIFSYAANPPLTFRFLLFGSFESLPHANGLQGAFCTGSQYTVQKLQFMSQGVMYTAMMLPLNAAMVEESIKTLVADQGKDTCLVMSDH
ncbi:hypothetical protein V8E54_008953 [Elaphomyces granulatus]